MIYAGFSNILTDNTSFYREPKSVNLVILFNM